MKLRWATRPIGAQRRTSRPPTVSLVVQRAGPAPGAQRGCGGVMPNISIVMATYNRASVLRITLEALTLQNCAETFEVLVCDDGSDDDTPLVVERLTARVPYALRYLRQERDGFRLSAARNLGL